MNHNESARKSLSKKKIFQIGDFGELQCLFRRETAPISETDSVRTPRELNQDCYDYRGYDYSRPKRVAEGF